MLNDSKKFSTLSDFESQFVNVEKLNYFNSNKKKKML